MSASYFGGEVRYTKRYRLGQLLGGLTRHFLLMSATPHNGKEEDFQLFLALLDGDRFECKFRDGVHVCDPSDLMRRLTKENLLKFDGTPLFPERIAYTVAYSLSDLEAELYKEVTGYVRQEFNRADQLDKDSRSTIGFALTTLQRRLASSPEAIYQSLRRRKERLEGRLREEKLLKRGADLKIESDKDLTTFSDDDIDDLDDAPEAEVQAVEEKVVDRATAARTIAELDAEIASLKVLEGLAIQVRRGGTDRKWDELSKLLQNKAEMFDAHGHRRKLIIFTEHRDTLNYLAERIRTLLGVPEAVVIIHGGIGREDRQKAQNAFTQDVDVQVLLATDAAGEGVNLQRAHLMVNYDLPWNPNRIEQRFGRIHRIGQTEVCHLWNLVAAETREGEVYQRLLEKLDEEGEALGGQVFDVLGKVTFDNHSLRDLILQAIRYGDQPEVKARLNQVVDAALDRDHLRKLLEEGNLAGNAMDSRKVQQIREDMERAEARRLQPHFIASFFQEAFGMLGGQLKGREPKRFEITHVPAVIRSRDRQIGVGRPVLTRYERVTFEKDLISVPGKPLAEFLCPGHPLLDSTIDIVLERHRDLLKRGAVLIDPTDAGENVRVLFYLEHAIQDSRTDRGGNRRVVSRRLQFVEVDSTGVTRPAGYAPYLDYRPATEEERQVVGPNLEEPWLREGLENRALSFAVAVLVPGHLDEVRKRKEELTTRTLAAVKERLTKEITYWDHRAQALQAREQAGKESDKLNSAKARQRADELQARLQKRLTELEQERKLSPQPPVVIGGALIVPAGLLDRLRGDRTDSPDAFARETARVERIAMEAVLEAERRLGHRPRDVSAAKCGYDVESSVVEAGRLRMIEVKGRVEGAKTVTVTKNEVLVGLNKPEDFILAIVEVNFDGHGVPRYVRRPFQREPDFGATSVNYDLSELLERAEDPE